MNCADIEVLEVWVRYPLQTTWHRRHDLEGEIGQDSGPLDRLPSPWPASSETSEGAPAVEP
jgi:hypothetical protein